MELSNCFTLSILDGRLGSQESQENNNITDKFVDISYSKAGIETQETDMRTCSPWVRDERLDLAALPDKQFCSLAIQDTGRGSIPTHFWPLNTS